MKCKICGHRANSLSAMGAHYRKKHPLRARARKTKRWTDRSQREESSRERIEASLIAFAERYNRGERLPRD